MPGADDPRPLSPKRTPQTEDLDDFGSVEDGSLLDLIGTVQLGSFRILRRLGVGGFATAFLAEQEGVDRLAVVKVADPRMVVSADDGTRKRFEEEVLATTRVTHPNLVAVYVAGSTTTGLPAYAMEYVPGFTLERRMQRCSALPSPELTAYFMQLADVLRLLHKAGIVHRDISPGNVILSADLDGAPKATLLDLGISLRRDTRDSLDTFIAGTPRYAAPEQLRGEPSSASDLFGLGSLLHYCVTGAELFWDATTVKDMLDRTLLMKEPPRPSNTRPSLPDEIDNIVGQLLDPDPASRMTADEFLARFPRAVRALERSASKATVQGFRTVTPAAEVRPPTILAVRLTQSELDALRKHAAATNWYVETTDNPRDATRAADGHYKVVVLRGEIESPGITPIVKHLREFQPKSAVIVAFARKSDQGLPADLRPDLSLELPKDGISLFWFLRALQSDSEGEDHE